MLKKWIVKYFSMTLKLLKRRIRSSIFKQALFVSVGMLRKVGSWPPKCHWQKNSFVLKPFQHELESVYEFGLFVCLPYGCHLSVVLNRLGLLWNWYMSLLLIYYRYIYAINGIENGVCSDETSFTGTLKRILLHYGPWGKIAWGVF